MAMKALEDERRNDRASDTLPTFDRISSVFAHIGLVGVIITTGIAAWFVPLASLDDPRPDLFLALAVVGMVVSFFVFSTGIRRVIKSASTAFALARVFRDSKDRFARATAGSREGLWEFDMKTGDAFFSEGWHNMLTLPAESVYSIDGWKKRIHPDDMRSVWDALVGHADGIRPVYGAEYRIMGGEREYVWIEDRGSGLVGEGQARIA